MLEKSRLILHILFFAQLLPQDVISLADLWVPGLLLGLIMLVAVYFVRVTLK